MTDDEAKSEETKHLLLDFFTEIAILEHLVRLRFEPNLSINLSAAEFGVLNYFCRLKKTEETLSGLAWCFQVDVAHQRISVDALAARGLVTLDTAENPCIRITAAGRTLHGEAVEDMAPEIVPIMAEIPLDDLRTTTATLKEIRRTFDNLPDR